MDPGKSTKTYLKNELKVKRSGVRNQVVKRRLSVQTPVPAKKQTNKKHISCQQVNEEMLNITNYEDNYKLKSNEMLLHTCYKDYCQRK
jgi:hypothetical protein